MQPTPHPNARTENNLAHYEWLRDIFDEVNMIDPFILAQAIENVNGKVIEWKWFKKTVIDITNPLMAYISSETSMMKGGAKGIAYGRYLPRMVETSTQLIHFSNHHLVMRKNG